MKIPAKHQRRRVGRPLKQGKRHPSGRLVQPSAAEKEREVKAVVMEYRKTQYGLTDDDAASDLAGHALGRIYLDRNITKAQFEAGLRYGDDMRRYYAHVIGMAPTIQAQNLMKVRGHDGEVTDKQAELGRQYSNRMMALEGVLLCEGTQCKRLVYEVCVNDSDVVRDAVNTVYMLGWFRQGLKALVKFYKMEDVQ